MVKILPSKEVAIPAISGSVESPLVNKLKLNFFFIALLGKK